MKHRMIGKGMAGGSRRGNQGGGRGGRERGEQQRSSSNTPGPLIKVQGSVIMDECSVIARQWSEKPTFPQLATMNTKRRRVQSRDSNWRNQRWCSYDKDQTCPQVSTDRKHHFNRKLICKDFIDKNKHILVIYLSQHCKVLEYYLLLTEAKNSIKNWIQNILIFIRVLHQTGCSR